MTFTSLRLGRHVFCMAALAVLMVLPSPAKAQEEPKVDAAIVLAIDCSFSVDANEYKQQMQGFGQAFQRPEIKKAIRDGAHGQIAVAAIHWSDDVHQAVIIPWRIIASDADADALGTLVAGTPRRLAAGGTSISMALQYSANLLKEAPRSERLIIDVSSDGRNNIGPPVKPIRDRIMAQGTTINAVVILKDWPTLDVYFRDNVVGGPDHFVIPSADYSTYADAIFRKLMREITGPGIT